MASSRVPFLPARADSDAPAEPTFLLVTGEEELRDDVALIAAVVGGRLDCRPGWPDVPAGGWAAMMCGPDALPPSGVPAEQVLLLGHVRSADPEPESLWRLAASRPGMQAVPLPQADVWLSEHLGGRVMDRAPGRVLGVAGVFGGVGATTVSYLLAAEAAARGMSALLVDGDPHPGSGIRTLLREQASSGAADGSLGWSALAQIEGELSSSQLQAALPVLEGIHVVSETGPGAESAAGPERDPAPLRTAEEVIGAGKRAFDLVILDAGRRPALLRAAADRLESVLMVAPSCGRAAHAADELMSAAPGVPFRLVLNGRPRAGWGAAEMRSALDVELVADIPEQRWLRRADEVGESYELLRSGRGAAMISGILQATGVLDG
ncbi:hypothetical protein ACFP47_01610 [Nesterenkonia lacusekhoensis]|uniref:Secretion/DNA translocation related CpaE-like protein n=1 Tax=Nesterenkonia lacusekhoensis TaxID=150832 RepID=A0ABS4T4U7_9MICC|nr:hypothetical protein [Nesterenkonia lacusekhoensis]MBP2319457.1 secretion/DNA translocation related CpaE-like protein [Nesterenkonia lacusekhoensis]